MVRDDSRNESMEKDRRDVVARPFQQSLFAFNLLALPTPSLSVDPSSSSSDGAHFRIFPLAVISRRCRLVGELHLQDHNHVLALRSEHGISRSEMKCNFKIPTSEVQVFFAQSPSLARTWPVITCRQAVD
jgi:hypothetical protein